MGLLLMCILRVKIMGKVKVSMFFFRVMLSKSSVKCFPRFLKSKENSYTKMCYEI